MDRAKCRDMPYEDAIRMFFPEKGQQWKDAKLVCLGDDDSPPCPVRAECLDYAMSFEPEGVVGIWGGTSHSERRKLHADTLTQKPSPVRSYRNLDRLGELLGLVSSVNREADNVAP